MRSAAYKIVSIICILACSLITAQQKDNRNNGLSSTEIWGAGLPYIENYSTDEYKNSPWNFSIVEGNNKYIYFGNGKGILEFDGNSWGYIATEMRGWIMALAKTDSDKIYVGGAGGELGYIEPDALGNMKYHSLRDYLDSQYLEFDTIWAIVIDNNYVYFSCSKYLFRWDGKEFKTWQAAGEFGEIFKVNGELYINNVSLGLLRVIKDKLILIHGSEILVDNKGKFPAKVRQIVEYKNNQLLLIHSHLGMLIYNGNSFEPINQKSNEVLKKHNVFGGVVLSNGDYAVATLVFGVYIIDGKTGEIKKRIGKKHGLTSNELYAIYEDINGAIWVCGGKGISKIEWAAPFRIFNETSGLDEIVTSVGYKSGKLFVDSNGLYQTTKGDLYAENKELVFKKIKGIRAGRLHDIIVGKNDIIAYNESQIYKITDTFTSQLIAEKDSNFSSLVKSNIYDSKFYFGTFENKLFDLTLVDDKWITRPLLETDGIITDIEEEILGDLWLAVNKKGCYFLRKLNGNPIEQSKFDIKKFDSLSGLPTSSGRYIFKFQKELVVSASDGFYKFNQIDQTFEKHSLWQNQYDDSNQELNYELFDQRGGVWNTTISDGVNKVFRCSDNKLSEIVEYKLFSDFELDYVEVMDDIALFVTTKGVLMYNPEKARYFNRNLTTKLRKVWLNNDSLVYAGSNNYKNDSNPFEIFHKNNDLRFEYALPFYTQSKKNEYQYHLDGYENDWSSWSTENKKDYTNLPEGDYAFRVRSKNIYDEIGSEDIYFFKVLPPWYRTWWAYLTYVLLAIGVVVLYSKWRSKELKRKNEILENLIVDRTTEIRQKNQLLNQQTKQLVQLNDSKTKLYSNITHEFRTPLTVILGLTETLKSNYKNKIFNEAEKSLNMIRRNGKNLLHLVNELLDLAKAESGSMELNLVQTDIIPYLKYLSESFSSLAASKNINLTVYSEIETLEMDVDTNKVASIVSNLLSNAIKFTPSNGKIIVHLNKIILKDESFFVFKTQDNGLGFSEKEKENLFDRFYQANNTVAGQQQGTGIGLSLTKEFVELMNGNILVESTPGKGSTFTVQIPICNNAEKIETLELPDKKLVVETLQSPKKELFTIKKSSNSPLVLIIEDNLDVAHYLETCLKGNYQIIHAIDGDDGIKMALENIPDIIISDVMMPKKDGFEVCASLKADERTDHIPIILLTAKVTIEDRLTGLTHGADAYLAKPFNQAELFTRLDQLILVRKKLIQKLDKIGFSSFLQDREENPQTKFLQEVIKSIHKNIDNVNFGPLQLAKDLHLSESHVYRKLKSITNKSTAIFIRSVRLQKAKELIQNSQKTISEIAYEVGFNDPSWFSRAFKEEFGYPPSEINK